MNDEAHCDYAILTSPPVDEPPRRGLSHREEKQQPSNLTVGVGSSGHTSPSTSGGGDSMEIGKSAAFGDSNGDGEADEDKTSHNSAGPTTLDNTTSSSTTSGEKALKRLVVVPRHYDRGDT